MAADWLDLPARNGFYRSTNNRVIAGVCAGIAARFGVKPWIVRTACTMVVVVPDHIAMIIPVILYGVLAFLLRPGETPLPEPDEQDRGPVSAMLNFVNDGDGSLARDGVPSASLRMRSLEARVAAIELAVTSGDFQLRRSFKDLERN